MQTVKTQHYVPRVYLRNFANPEEGNLFCLDKTDLKQFEVNIKNIGCEKWFYSDKGEDQRLEKTLSALEGNFAEVYEKLSSCHTLYGLKWEDKKIIACFVAVQDVRTREFRETVKGYGQEIKTWLSDKTLSKELEEQLKAIGTEEQGREIQNDLLTDALGMGKVPRIILGMKWILFENRTKIPLWSSDHPVNKHNPIDQTPLGNMGFLSQGIQVFFPLSPTLGMIFCDPVEYCLLPDKMTAIKDYIMLWNDLQVRFSTRHVFSSTGDFSFALKRLRESPELRELDRKRVEGSA
jgi:hypothetical protein